MSAYEEAAERLVRDAWKTPPSIQVRSEDLTQAVLLDLAPDAIDALADGVAESRDGGLPMAGAHWDTLTEERQHELQRAVNASYLQRVIAVVQKLARADSYYAAHVEPDPATVALMAATHPSWPEAEHGE